MSRTQFTLLLPFALLISACTPTRAQTTDLVVEEYRLVEPPTVDPLTFKPEVGSMPEILSRRAADRSRVLAEASAIVDGRHAILAALGPETLVATEFYGGRGSPSWVTVMRNDREIYRIDTGMPSPIPGLQGLWTYEDHWVLETARITPDTIGGRLSRDGALLRPLADDEEAFDFQLMAGRPFFFFSVDGKIGLSLDGEELTTFYDEIPHYQCCSASILNPLHAQTMVAFFARRGDSWYYVEAGLFGD